MESSPSLSPGSVQPKFEFIVWDKETSDSSDGKGFLKPGVDRTEALKQAIFRADMEGKGNWPKTLIRIASHGRALLRYRWYAFGIAYSQKTMNLMFTFLTRQGMFVSPTLSLESRKLGLKSDLPVICSTLFSLHFSSPYQLSRHPLIYFSGADIPSILLPGASPSSGMEWRQIEKVLRRRDCVRGRGTIVFVVAPAGPFLDEEGKDDMTGPLSSRKRKAETQLRDAPNAKRVKLNSLQSCPLSAVEWWNEIISHPDLDLAKALQDSVKDLQVSCDQMVVKVGSALSVDVDAQLGMWNVARGTHGVLDVCGIIKLKHGLDIFRDLNDVGSVPKWTALYHFNDPPLKVEDRTELITIMKDNENPLSEVHDMRTMLKAIIDAVIGPCAHQFL